MFGLLTFYLPFDIMTINKCSTKSTAIFKWFKFVSILLALNRKTRDIEAVKPIPFSCLCNPFPEFLPVVRLANHVVLQQQIDKRYVKLQTKLEKIENILNETFSLRKYDSKKGTARYIWK